MESKGMPKLPPLEDVLKAMREKSAPGVRGKFPTGVISDESLEIVIASDQGIARGIEEINPALKPYQVSYTDFDVASRLIGKLELLYPNSRLNYFWSFPEFAPKSPYRESAYEFNKELRRRQAKDKVQMVEGEVNKLWDGVLNKNLIFIWDQCFVQRLQPRSLGYLPSDQCRYYWALEFVDKNGHQLVDYEELIKKGVGIGRLKRQD